MQESLLVFKWIKSAVVYVRQPSWTEGPDSFWNSFKLSAKFTHT